MAGKRKEAEAFILKYIDKMVGESNVKIYEDLFASMSDKDFDEFMKKIKEKKARLAVVVPNLVKSKLSTSNNLGLAKELKHNFFERIYIDRGDGQPKYLTPIPYLIVELPLRRQAQFLVEKISIPEDNRSVDDMTGQPTGASKGSKISYPETQILAALGLDNCLLEMVKFRGGDTKGFNAMNASISKTGSVSLEEIEKLGTTVESTRTLHTILLGMHLKSTLLE